MPTPAKTSREEILRVAAEMVEAGGIRSVTMLGIAKRVGVKGASLYKHFPSAESILAALERRNFEDLGQSLAAASPGLEALAHAFLDFARQRPEQSKLLFRHGDPAISLDAMRPALKKLTDLLGDQEEALVRLRILTCFLHGYHLMMAGGAFRQDGDIAPIVERALQLIVPEERLPNVQAEQGSGRYHPPYDNESH